MTGFLLFQMSYSLIGEDRHKWHGIVLLILFVFFDFEEPPVFFILDYPAVMWLFAWFILSSRVDETVFGKKSKK